MLSLPITSACRLPSSCPGTKSRSSRVPESPANLFSLALGSITATSTRAHGDGACTGPCRPWPRAVGCFLAVPQDSDLL